MPQRKGKGKVALLLKEIRKNKFFYLLPIPGIIFLIMFCYLPMAGLYVVFEKYTYQGGLFGSEFVGLRNFEFFFKNMSNALRATRNTLIINGFSIILGTIINVAIAIALDEIKKKKFVRCAQSLMLFPYFISWVVVGMVAMTLLENDRGIINQILGWFGIRQVNWYASPQYWWGILVLFNIWKGAGYGSIIYYCALIGFDPGYYEAARIDGANNRQRIWYITIPLLRPTIITMFLLSIGGILAGGVDQIMGMTNLNPLILETTDTIATFVYRTAILNGQFESASAITLYQSFFGFALVMGANMLVKRVDKDYALF